MRDGYVTMTLLSPHIIRMSLLRSVMVIIGMIIWIGVKMHTY